VGGGIVDMKILQHWVHVDRSVVVVVVVVGNVVVTLDKLLL